MRSYVLVLATLLALGACKRVLPTDLPICAAEVAGGTAVESEARELPPAIWYSIMLQGFDRERMLAGDEPKDCTGRSILHPTPPPPGEGELLDDPTVVAGCPIGRDVEAGRLPARALTDEDIVIDEGPDGTSLVWVQASHYDNGEASGPVALVEWNRAGVAIRALGSLRAQTHEARMRIEVAGGQRLLVVESDECSADQQLCRRILRLLPILDGHIATVPLELEGGAACLGEAAFAVYEQYTSNLPDGWIRKFEIRRSVTFDSGTPLVAEQVVIRDQDPNTPESPTQEFREAASERRLIYVDRHFETRASLWEDMIENYGSVAHDAGADKP